jgi:hypothetical protein
MHCHNCGTQLSSGIQFCPNCGTAVPNNVSQPVLIDPTMAAPPYQPSPIPPTSYGAPPPPSPNPPVPDPYAKYNPPGQQTPYGYNATPTPIPPALNSYQQYAPIPNYNQAQPFPTLPVTPPRKNRTGLIIGITATVLVVIIGGLCALGTNLASKSTTSNSTTTTQTSDTTTPVVENTPTPGMTSSTTPSGNIIDPTATLIVTDAQTASSVNQITAAPTNLTDTFQTNTDIYVTFKLNNDKFDFSKNTGYVAVKFYADSTALTLPATLNTPLTISEPAPGGFFKVQYITAAQGAAELYWCQQPDCSDEQLAQVVTFTVTS